MYIYNKKGLYHYLHIAREPKVQHIFCSETIIYMILHFNIYANISILVFFSICVHWDIKLSKQTTISLDYFQILDYIKIPLCIHLSKIYPCTAYLLSTQFFFSSLNWVSDNGDKMSFNTQSTSDMKKSLKIRLLKLRICSSS